MVRFYGIQIKIFEINESNGNGTEIFENYEVVNVKKVIETINGAQNNAVRYYKNHIQPINGMK